MPIIDPSPLLFVVVPAFAAMVYATHRGILKNEFRLPYRWGWHRFETWSLDWALSTTVNFVLAASLGFSTYFAMFHGSKLFERNEAEVHCIEGAEMVTADSCSEQ